MIGRSTTGGASAAVLPGTGAGTNAYSAPSSSGQFGIATVVLLIIFGVLYVVWALVERHERVSKAIEPKALALNLRNLAAILLPVVFGIPLLKVGAAKYKAWGLPYGDIVSNYFGAL